MSRRRVRVAACLSLVALTLLAVPARAVAPVIADAGEFFSAEAVKKANEQIRELYRKYQRDLLIETFKGPPEADAEKIKAMSRGDREKYYEKWARQRGESVGVNGIYILATKQPAFLQVEVSPSFGSVVDETARRRLVDMLLNDFRDKHFDAALDDAIKFLRVKLEDAGKK